MLNCSYFLAGIISPNNYFILHTLLLFLFGYIAISVSSETFDYILIGLILGGGVWNLIERVLYGCVQDYFSFFGLFYFNFADLAVVTGVLTLLLRAGIKSIMPK